MTRTYKLALAALGTLLLTLFASPLAFAESGSGSNSGSSSTDDSDSSDSSSSDSKTSDTTENETETEAEHAKQTPAQLKEHAQEHATETKQKVDSFKALAKERIQQNKDKSGKKLDAGKLDICKKRETTINTVMVRIGERGGKQLNLINTVFERVQTYKTDNNLTVDGYDALVAAATTQKTAAASAVDAAKAVQASFKCDGSDPTGAASTFRDAMKTQNTALKNYRNSVIDLLKAVKKAKGSTSDSPSPSPSPSPTPTPSPSPQPVTTTNTEGGTND